MAVPNFTQNQTQGLAAAPARLVAHPAVAAAAAAPSTGGTGGVGGVFDQSAGLLQLAQAPPPTPHAPAAAAANPYATQPTQAAVNHQQTQGALGTTAPGSTLGGQIGSGGVGGADITSPGWGGPNNMDPGTGMVAAANAGLNGSYINNQAVYDQSTTHPTMNNLESDIYDANAYGLGNNDAASNQAIAQAQDTGQYYSGVYGSQAQQAGALSQAAGTRGLSAYQGDTSAYNNSMTTSGTDRGLQLNGYNALGAIASSNPQSDAAGALANAGGSYGALNQFASQPLTMDAQGQLNSVGQSAGSLSSIGNSQFALNGQTQGQLAASGQDASGLTAFGNQIGAGPSVAAGNLANAANNAGSMTNFGNSAIGPSAGAANLQNAAGAAGSLGAMGNSGTQNAAAQQFAQANQQYNNMQAFQAAPIGASAAEQQLLQSTDANTQNALAMARSGSGMGGDATAMKQALLANAGTQQTANSQMAQLRANEYTAYQGQKLQAQGQAGSLASTMGNLAATQYDAQRGQNEQALQSQGDLSNTAAGLQINNQLQQQQQRQAALQAGAATYDANGNLQITEQNNNQNNTISALNAAGALNNQAASTTASAQLQGEQNRINALNQAGSLQNQAASTVTSAQNANQQAQLAALSNAGQLANQTAGLQIGQQEANQQLQLNAATNMGQLGTATTNADIARAQAGLQGAQYQTTTALQGTQLNDATSQAWAAQQQAAYQQALAAEVGSQTQSLNISNDALAGRESLGSAQQQHYATNKGLATQAAIAQAQQTQAYVGAGLSAAGTIGAAALSDETEKDIAVPLGYKAPSPPSPQSVGSRIGAGPGTGPVTVSGAVPQNQSAAKANTSAPSMGGGPSLAQQSAAASAQHAATGAAVGGTVGQVGGAVVGSAVAGPVGGIVGGLVGKIGGGLVGKLVGSDVSNKTNIQPLSASPGVANGKGAFGALQALAAQQGIQAAATSKEVAKYAAGKPMTMPPMSVTDNQSLKRLTAPGMQGVGPTGNPGDAFLASSARAAPPSAYTYKDPSAPGAAPGMQVGPMAQDLASHPVTAPAVGTNPRTGKLMVDPGRLALANTAQNHSQQNQLDALDGKLNSVAGMLRGSSPYPTLQQPDDDDPYGLSRGSLGYGGRY